MRRQTIIRNNKKIWFLFSIILITMLFTLLLNSCNTQDNQDEYDGRGKVIPCNLAIIYSNRQNSAAGINANLLGPYIMGALQKDINGNTVNDNQLIIISSDGKNKKAYEQFGRSDKYNQSNIEKENKEYTNNVLDYLKKFDAENEESDIMNAISKANSEFNDKNSNENIIIVIDSGISTKGNLFNFTDQNIFGMNTTDVNKDKIPNLNKTDKIIWTGFNMTDGQQDEMPSQIRDNIKQLYTDILTQSIRNNNKDNAIEFLEGTSNKKYKTPNDQLPNVTLISFPDGTTKIENGKYILPDTILKFCPDTAIFLDNDKAKLVINEVAEFLKKNNTVKIQINGYIAIPNIETGSLSKERAERVKKELISMGINEERIITNGCGKGPYPYLTPNGDINSENRFIEIVEI